MRVVRRGEKEPLAFRILRDKIPLNTIDAAYRIGDSVGYIKVNRFGRTTMEEFRNAYRRLQPVGALILDLRGNGGGLFEQAIGRFGRVDGVVNNAATNPYFGPLIDTPDAAIDKTLEVNLKGYLYVARALVKHARARGGGASWAAASFSAARSAGRLCAGAWARAASRSASVRVPSAILPAYQLRGRVREMPATRDRRAAA